MRLLVEGLRYHSLDMPFVDGLKPYAHQLGSLDLVREALRTNRTVCIENASVTGSGKTLANFAAAILDDTRTIGVYPTNELLLDQHGSIRKHLINQLLILDSEGLDDIMAEETHMRSHAHALAWATGDDMRTALLTNPDVLYLAMYSLYGRMFSTFAQSYGARIFQYVLSNYPVIAFDEFHLYSTKQIANAAFIVGTARELAPDKPHIFICDCSALDQRALYLTTGSGRLRCPKRQAKDDRERRGSARAAWDGRGSRIVERELRIRQKAVAPGGLRNVPEIFCCTLTIRRSRSAWLRVMDTAPSSTKASTCSAW
jgi:hypothetical protein